MAEGLLHLLDLRHVQRIVGAVARDDQGADRHAQGVQGGDGDLQLRQVVAVLAVAELEEALFGNHAGMRVGGGAIQTEARGAQVVDAHGILVEVVLESQPGIGLRQGIEEVGEAVVVEVKRSDGLAEQGLESEEVLLGPGL